MREIKVQEITAAVSKLCKDSCYYLPEELLEKLKAYWELQGEIRGEVEREGVICGFRTAYHLLNECRS